MLKTTVEKMAKEKKALVTGACGDIGANLTLLLLEKGYSVRATDLEESTSCTGKENKYYIQNSEAEFQSSDLTKPETLEDIVKDVDIIFHTASLFNYYSPTDVMRGVNVQGTRNLCDAVIEHNPDLEKFMHWSTGEVYGFNMMDEEDLPPSGALKENASKTPGESPYAQTKWEQEQVIWEYHEEYDLPAISLRLASVYGPGTLVETLFCYLITRGIVNVFPRNLSFKWPLVHVEDTMWSALHLAENGEEGEAYNISDDQDYTAADVFYAIADETGNELYSIPTVLGVSTLMSLARPFLSLFKYPISAMIDGVRSQGVKPMVGKSTVEGYMEVLKDIDDFAENFYYSNEKLKDTGYEPKYPDYRDSVHETYKWYREIGYI